MSFPRTDKDKKCTGDYASELDRIDVLVLLDLIGGLNPKFQSFFAETLPLHKRLVNTGMLYIPRLL